MSLPFLNRNGTIYDINTVKEVEPDYRGLCIVTSSGGVMGTHFTWIENSERKWEFVCEGFPSNETILHYHG